MQGLGSSLVLEVDQAGSIGVVTAVGAVLSALAASWAVEVALGGTLVGAIVVMATGGGCGLRRPSTATRSLASLLVAARAIGAIVRAISFRRFQQPAT